MRRAVLVLTVAAAVSMANAKAHTQDFEREARWRAEVVPGLVVGEAVEIPGPGQRPFLGIVTEPANVDRAATTLLVLVHGIGVHPDHGIIGRLRMDLADKGFATLSIQMPVLASDAPPEHYALLFGNAAERIGNAAVWSRSRGYRDLVLVSHSLGSRMADAYFGRTVPPAFRAWVSLGLGAPFSATLAQRPPVPVLDVYGELDLDSVRSTAPERAKVAVSSGARQQRIGGADHFYAGHEAELVSLIAGFAARK